MESLVPSVEVVSRLLEAVYEAAACPERWPDFLDLLRREAAAEKAFILLDSGGRCDLSFQVGFDDAAVRAYNDYYSQRDVLLQGYVRQLQTRDQWIGTDQSVIAEEDLRRSEAFNDFMKPNGDAHQCGMGLVGLGDGLYGGISMLRGDAAGDFGEDMVSLLAVLAPHVKRAYGLHRRMTEMRGETADLRQSVESVGVAMVSVDAMGRVIRMSLAAQRLLEARDGLEVLGGRLVASRPEEQMRLEALIVGAAQTGSGAKNGRRIAVGRKASPQAASGLVSAASGGGVVVARRAPKAALQVVVSPFRSAEILLEDRPAALVFLKDPDAAPASRGELLVSMYGLSPMEGRVADLLSAGLEVREIGERLGLTEQTVRFYLKAVFRKMGARRQSDVVRLAVGLPGI